MKAVVEVRRRLVAQPGAWARAFWLALALLVAVVLLVSSLGGTGTPSRTTSVRRAVVQGSRVRVHGLGSAEGGRGRTPRRRAVVASAAVALRQRPVDRALVQALGASQMKSSMASSSALVLPPPGVQGGWPRTTAGNGHDAMRSVQRIALVLQLGLVARHPGYGTALFEEV